MERARLPLDLMLSIANCLRLEGARWHHQDGTGWHRDARGGSPRLSPHRSLVGEEITAPRGGAMHAHPLRGAGGRL